MSNKPNLFESHRHLDPAFKELAHNRRQAVANAHYWVYDAMIKTDSGLAAELQAEDHKLLANAAMQASLDAPSMPETTVAEPTEAENILTGEDDGVNDKLLDDLENDSKSIG